MEQAINKCFYQLLYGHYQWLPLWLILSAAALYLPRLIWEAFEKGTLDKVCKGLSDQDLEEMDYVPELVGHQLQRLYNIEAATPAVPAGQSALEAEVTRAQDPKNSAEETTVAVTFQRTSTVKNVSKLLNFLRVFRVRHTSYARKFLGCQILNVILAALQVKIFRLATNPEIKLNNFTVLRLRRSSGRPIRLPGNQPVVALGEALSPGISKSA